MEEVKLSLEAEKKERNTLKNVLNLMCTLWLISKMTKCPPPTFCFRIYCGFISTVSSENGIADILIVCNRKYKDHRYLLWKMCIMKFIWNVVYKDPSDCIFECHKTIKWLRAKKATSPSSNHIELQLICRTCIKLMHFTKPPRKNKVSYIDSFIMI